jgi:hypothetical protein
VRGCLEWHQTIKPFLHEAQLRKPKMVIAFNEQPTCERGSSFKTQSQGIDCLIAEVFNSVG